jgi:ComF family protein
LREKPSRNTIFCHNCADHFYDSAHAIGVYEKALAASILELKRSPFIPKKLREHLLSALDRMEFTDAGVIVPVPLSAKRRLERGFNQAEAIAAFISSEIGLRVEKDILERSLHTAIHRVAMDKKAREMSVAKAFKLAQPEKIVGKDVLLVDDVLTSGATVSACAKTLKKGGARSVRVLTLGRVVLR